ncbi:MAG: acetoin dehydrogenase [Gammaproteobacteria bacterium]|nr:acetoin dehydrogenase [Gammaproteobacteria bacterium]
MSRAEFLTLYRGLLRLRLVEETIASRYSEQEMRCPVHLSVGQEASAVGACSPLTERDVIVSTHRSHGHYLAKGGSLIAMLAEIYGRETGCCGGRGGSMHLFDKKVGVLASVPIVGSTIPLGVGAALAFQQRGETRVSMVFMGDAATEEGVFHESLNFASLLNLPVVFFVENNLYSVYTHIRERQPERPLTAYAKAHEIPSIRVDGNDVLVVREAAYEMVERARQNQGPSLIVADTYRWREHCGPNYDNDLGYRTISEFKDWKHLCPVKKLQEHLIVLEFLNDKIVADLTEQIETEIKEAFDSARKAPFPLPESAGLRVYA